MPGGAKLHKIRGKKTRMWFPGERDKNIAAHLQAWVIVFIRFISGQIKPAGQFPSEV